MPLGGMPMVGGGVMPLPVHVVGDVSLLDGVGQSAPTHRWRRRPVVQATSSGSATRPALLPTLLENDIDSVAELRLLGGRLPGDGDLDRATRSSPRRWWPWALLQPPAAVLHPENATAAAAAATTTAAQWRRRLRI